MAAWAFVKLAPRALLATSRCKLGRTTMVAAPSSSTAPCNWAFGDKSWCLPPPTSATGAMAEIASAEQCRIHILDVPARLGRSLHPVCTPCNWEWHQYAMEVWLDRAVRAWPNLVSRAG